MNKTPKRKTSSEVSEIETRTTTDEINDNEEILQELDECLKNKNETVSQLKQTISHLETDIKRFVSPYNCEKATLEEDILLFRSIANRYVKHDLIDFYVERMRLSAENKIDSESSAISALCEIISKDNH